MDTIQFNKHLKQGPTIVLIGKRDTGKSFLIRDILYHHRDIPVGTVISGTEEANPFYGDIIPRIFIHYDYSSYFLENVLKRQKKIVSQFQNEAAQYGRSNVDPRTFVILDDCLYNAKLWARDTLMRYIFMNGRHLKIMILITMQYPLGIPPDLRTNVDFVFILRTPIIKDRLRIYDHYAGMFPTFETFCQTMDSCTNNFECMVIHNASKSNNIEDMVYWYKADSHPDFRMCNRTYWEISKNIVNQDEDAGEQPLTSTRRRANQPSLNVQKLH